MPCAVRRPRPAHARRPDRPAGALHRGAPPRRGADLARRGARILDFGQNLVGRVRLRVDGPGRHDGDASARPRCCRTARSTRGRCAKRARPTATRSPGARAARTWEPRFTFHGFRYAEVDGWPGDLDAAAAAGDLVARVYHTDLERTGWFESSDPLVEPAARERRVGHARQLRRHPDRLPAARRAPRLDRRHPGLRARPRRSCTTRPGMLERLAARPRRRAAADGTVPWYVPGDPRARDVDADPPRRRLGRCRHRSPRGRCTSASATPASWPRSSTARDAGSTSCPRSPAPAGCGTPASSSATGSTPPRPRRIPADAAHRPLPGRDRLLRAVGADASRRWPRCSGRADDAARYVALADEVDAAFAARVRRCPTGG